MAAASSSRSLPTTSLRAICAQFGRGHVRQSVGGRPGADHLQLAGEKIVAAGVALDLAARGFGDAAGLDEHDGIDRQFVFGGDGAADGLENGIQIGLLAAFDFLDDDQLLAAVFFHGEDPAAIEPQPRMALLDGQFDVLRIMIDAVEDDQVLEAAGDEEFAVLNEARGRRCA